MSEKPKTGRETIDQIWYALYGTNGSIGLIDRVIHLEKSPGRFFRIAKDFALLAATVLIFLFGSGVL